MGSIIKVSLFYCSNSISPEHIKQLGSQLDSTELKAIALPCTGKLAFEYILKSIETGSDIAIVAGCMEGECRYLQGNLRARKRVEAINNLLIEAGAGGESAWFIHLNDNIKNEDLINDLKICIRQIISEHENTTVLL
jgi:F420-non-reducing hydrogenase iron-sulfur subunit